MSRSKNNNKTVSSWLIPAISLVILALFAGGAWLYVVQRDRVQAAAEENLDAIARLKVDQIVQWRNERLGDAAVLMENPYSSEALARWISGNRGDGTEQVLALFRSLRAHYRYSDIILVDPSGRMLLSLNGQTGNLGKEVSQAVGDSLRERRPLLSDLYAGTGEGVPHLDAIALLRAGNGNDSRALGAKSAEYVGAVILRCDAKDFLYPLLQSWPLPSRSGETLLVRRDGGDVLYLNDLLHQAHTALSLRIPLSRKDTPAVAAVMGKQGVFYGKDYRGVRVMAALAYLIAEMKPGLKILFMSGYTADVIAHQGILERGVSFVSKPFSMNALAEKVREVLG